MGRHRDTRLNHIIENWTFVDQTEREALSDALPEDIGKVAFQESDNTYWRLTNDSPLTWVAIGASSGGGATITRKIAPADLTGVTFDFSSIPATHRNLRLIFVGRVVSTGTGDDIPLIARLKFNNSFGGVAIKTSQVGAAAPVTSLTANVAAGIEIGEVQSLNANPGFGSTQMSEIIFEMLEYANTTIGRGSHSKNYWKDSTGVICRNEYVCPTATSTAINRLTLSFDAIAAGTLRANSYCVLELTD